MAKLPTVREDDQGEGGVRVCILGGGGGVEDDDESSNEWDSSCTRQNSASIDGIESLSWGRAPCRFVRDDGLFRLV